MIRVSVEPNMIRWAIERANLRKEDLAKKFKKLPEWEKGEIKPTLKQLEKFAHVVRVPYVHLLFSDPPAEPGLIPDFRTPSRQQKTRVSLDLMDTILVCQERHDWYIDYMREIDEDGLPFVGSATLETPHEKVARMMHDTLGFKVEDRSCYRTWDEALRGLIQKAEIMEILVMVSGVVANNTHRRLDPREFCGFALTDKLASLVFVNGALPKSAQMIALAHELAHIWLGVSAMSSLVVEPTRDIHEVETWCGGVAAEFLLPLASMQDELQGNEELEDTLHRLALAFKVIELLVLRRLLDAKHLTRKDFRKAWAKKLK